MRAPRVVLIAAASTSVLAAGWVAGEVAANDGQELIIDAAPSATTDTASQETNETTAAASTQAAESQASESQAAETQAEQTQPAETEAAPSGTFNGAVVNNARGNFEAVVTVDQGVITAVDVLQSGTSERESERINEMAVPQLVERVLQAQTWDVEAVSGASYTSDGLRASIQDALAQAGLA